MAQTDLKIFLKLLKKHGYPNKDVLSMEKMIGYTPDKFITDLYEWDEKKANKFVLDAARKLYDGDKGIKLTEIADSDSYLYLLVDHAQIIIEEDSVDFWVSWGDSILSVDGEELDISTYIEQSDFVEYEEFRQEIESEFHELILKNCGFHCGITFQ